MTQNTTVEVWKKIIIACITAACALGAMYLGRVFLNTQAFVSDTGGLSAFTSVYGTLYGILLAFIIFEVWNQFNKTSELLDQEALGLERLFALSLDFRDKQFAARMKKRIQAYIQLVTKDFDALGKGQRPKESSKAFRKIAQQLRKITFDDDHDQTVFRSIIEQYGRLAEVRAARINQSLARLPVMLKVFLYLSSFFTVAIAVLMPFANSYYGVLTVIALVVTMTLALQIVVDLDNPFAGVWVVTPEPFERTLQHIENDY